MLKRYPTLLLMLIIVAGSSLTAAYGHGLGTDRSLPVTISNRQVAVEASLRPTFMDAIGDVQPTFIVRTLDAGSNSTISGINYRIAVELRSETLLNQRFRSQDGIVAATLIPDASIDGWQIASREQASPDEQIETSQGNPVQIRSKILSAGGLYHVTVTIEKESPGLFVQSDQKFDLYVSVGRTFIFDVETPAGGQEMSVKTYYDDVTDFDYSANSTISFAMPFAWDPEYVSQVPLLHLEVQFPKSIKELQSNSYEGALNSIELPADAILIDDYSYEDLRVVHFLVSNARLTTYVKSLAGADEAVFALVPAEKPRFPLDILTPTEKYLFQLSWDPEVIETGLQTTFLMNLQDPKTGDLLRNSAFDFVLIQDGREIYRQHLTSSLGAYSLKYVFGQAGTVRLEAKSINGEDERASIDLVVLPGSSPPPNPTPQPSGCLIATAAFGSELTPQVQFLRSFRDNYIMQSTSGAAFMGAFNSIYYSFSPAVADYERDQPWLQQAVKAGLYPLFGILLASEKAYWAAGGSEAGTVLAGASTSAMIGAVYLSPVAIAGSRRFSGRMLLAIIGAAVAALAIAVLSATPLLLAAGTSAFVLAIAAASAIAAAKAARHIFRR